MKRFGGFEYQMMKRNISTNYTPDATGTRISELNDHCLSELLSLRCFTVKSLCSIADMSEKFHEILTRILIHKDKIWHSPEEWILTLDEAERMLINFGSFIFQLRIDRFSLKFQPQFDYRHKRLQAFQITQDNYQNHLLPIIAEKCEKLDYLEIGDLGTLSTVAYERVYKGLGSMQHLRDLLIFCSGLNVTKVIQHLISVNSLESLELWNLHSDSEFIVALSQLKQLGALRINSCRDLENVNLLGELYKLHELVIRQFDRNIDIDLVRLIDNLNNLRCLCICSNEFKLDDDIRERIEGIFRRKPGRPQFSLEVETVSIQTTRVVLFNNH